MCTNYRLERSAQCLEINFYWLDLPPTRLPTITGRTACWRHKRQGDRSDESARICESCPSNRQGKDMCAVIQRKRWTDPFGTMRTQHGSVAFQFGFALFCLVKIFFCIAENLYYQARDRSISRTHRLSFFICTKFLKLEKNKLLKCFVYHSLVRYRRL